MNNARTKGNDSAADSLSTDSLSSKSNNVYPKIDILQEKTKK